MDDDFQEKITSTFKRVIEKLFRNDKAEVYFKVKKEVYRQQIAIEWKAGNWEGQTFITYKGSKEINVKELNGILSYLYMMEK